MTDVRILEEAEERLLRTVDKKKGSGLEPSELIDGAEAGSPSIPRHTVRYAYWSLLGRHVLTRNADGLVVRGEQPA